MDVAIPALSHLTGAAAPGSFCLLQTAVFRLESGQQGELEIDSAGLVFYPREDGTEALESKLTRE